MMKLVLFSLFILLSHSAYSQSCVMNEDAKRYYNRGVTATQIAKNTDDYKNALAEYQKAAELCSDCAELYYRMGLCCEMIGEDDNSYYSSALKYFKQSLTAENNISQELKDLIQGKIDGMGYAVEQAAVANKDALIPENLCGIWRFHTSDGRSSKFDKVYDIVISENQGFYSVNFVIVDRYDADERNGLPDTPSMVFREDADIRFKDNVVCFHTIYNDVKYGSDGAQAVHSKAEYDYELILENGVLKGVRKCTYEFWAAGNSDYHTVMEAVSNGYGKVYVNCTGNCGTANVYFTR